MSELQAFGFGCEKYFASLHKRGKMSGAVFGKLAVAVEVEKADFRILGNSHYRQFGFKTANVDFMEFIRHNMLLCVGVSYYGIMKYGTV